MAQVAKCRTDEEERTVRTHVRRRIYILPGEQRRSHCVYLLLQADRLKSSSYTALPDEGRASVLPSYSVMLEAEYSLQIVNGHLNPRTPSARSCSMCLAKQMSVVMGSVDQVRYISFKPTDEVKCRKCLASLTRPNVHSQMTYCSF